MGLHHKLPHFNRADLRLIAHPLPGQLLAANNQLWLSLIPVDRDVAFVLNSAGVRSKLLHLHMGSQGYIAIGSNNPTPAAHVDNNPLWSLVR